MPAKTKTPKTTKTYSPEDLRKMAAVEYAKDAKDEAAPLPARAKRTISEKTGIPAAKLASYVDPLYFKRNGERNPISLPKTRTEKTLAIAVRKRRDAGGTLGRWESVASALAASLGRPVSEVSVRALYSKSGSDIEASYTGRGTRKSAPKTRDDATAEVETAS